MMFCFINQTSEFDPYFDGFCGGILVQKKNVIDKIVFKNGANNISYNTKLILSVLAFFTLISVWKIH